jgi:hypothetical protein
MTQLRQWEQLEEDGEQFLRAMGWSGPRGSLDAWGSGVVFFKKSLHVCIY